MARRSLLVGAAAIVAAGAGALAIAGAGAEAPAGPPPRTPSKHVVVIFGENHSFDYFFATYPHAANPPGQPAFTGTIGSQTINNLETANLLGNNNPSSQKPRRLDRSEAVTCGFDHGYAAEQRAFNGGLMDKFPENTDRPAPGGCGDKTVVMSYYDGNTVTAYWNYAQHFAMSDAHFGTTFGPSTIGAINLISGNTHGATGFGAGGAIENGTMISNLRPDLDDCKTGATATMSGRNIGDLMNDAGVTWGWFAGGFKPVSRDGAGNAVCGGTHKNAAGADVADYFPHHAPFQFYATTANPHHLPPTSVAAIGTTDQANHQYDLTDFSAALAAGNLPQVSFLKAVSAEDGHPGYSGPLDEQRFVANTLNELQKSPEWASTAVFLAYDDSDGWYDHAFIPPQQGSRAASDALDGVGVCGGDPGPGAYQNRCGPGPRLPLLLVSPWAKQNFIDHTQTEQTSIIRFIEDNWNLGQIGDQSFDARAQPLTNMFDFGSGGGKAPKVFVDPTTGLITSIGDPPPPGPTVVPTVTPTKPPTTTPKPAKVAVKLKCKVSGAGKRFKLTCKATGKDAKRKTSLRIQIRKGSRVLATAKTSLKKKKATVTIKAKRTIKKGKYTLRITLSQTGRTSLTTKKTIRLKK
jgi:phospholipase C